MGSPCFTIAPKFPDVPIIPLIVGLALLKSLAHGRFLLPGRTRHSAWPSVMPSPLDAHWQTHQLRTKATKGTSMAYAFAQSDANLSASLRRILREELDSAITQLARMDDPQAVHGLRKNLKKSRSILRLVRKGLAEQPALNIALREVGLALSAHRDAEVRLATLDRLFPDRPPALQPLRDTLASARTDLPTRPSGKLLKTLIAVRDNAEDLSLDGKDDRILHAGLAATRRKARHAAERARTSSGSVELFHDWRKRSKDHWYQARLFAPVWPALFRPIVADANRLGEILGDHHDVSVLAAHVADLPENLLPDPSRQMLDAGLDDAQRRFADEAFDISARLFAGEPDDLAGFWIDLRRAWRARDR